jgi:hypothetical protein
MTMKRFEGVYLLKNVEIAFVASFQSLVCLFAFEHLNSALYDDFQDLNHYRKMKLVPLANTSFLLREERSSGHLAQGPSAM